MVSNLKTKPNLILGSIRSYQSKPFAYLIEWNKLFTIILIRKLLILSVDVADCLDKSFVHIKLRHEINKGVGDLEEAATYTKAILYGYAMPILCVNEDSPMDWGNAIAKQISS